MALKNFQYNRLLQQYDETQFHNRHLEEKRYQEVIHIIPEIEQIDNEITSNGIAYAKMALTDNQISAAELDATNQVLVRQKKQLLLAHGFPADYLSPIYNCPDCKDTGFIEGEKCHCFKQAIINFLYEQANLGHILKSENFNHFRFDYYADDWKDPYLRLTPRENIEHIVKDCQKFIASFEDQYNNILVYGNTGVGKTFLVNCIAKEILDMSYTVVYLTSFQFFDIMEKHTFSRSLEEKTEAAHQFEHIFDCDLLIIDDLGTETVNSFIASQLYQCMNERHLHKKSTIISTNLSFDDIKNRYSERVFSRIVSNYKPFKIIGTDIRLK